jgi:hypothetical protein
MVEESPTSRLQLPEKNPESKDKEYATTLDTFLKGLQVSLKKQHPKSQHIHHFQLHLFGSFIAENFSSKNLLILDNLSVSSVEGLFVFQKPKQPLLLRSKKSY